ncbi:MAG: hypothetical protein V1859_04145 [archaeon]
MQSQNRIYFIIIVLMLLISCGRETNENIHNISKEAHDVNDDYQKNSTVTHSNVDAKKFLEETHSVKFNIEMCYANSPRGNTVVASCMRRIAVKFMDDYLCNLSASIEQKYEGDYNKCLDDVKEAIINNAISLNNSLTCSNANRTEVKDLCYYQVAISSKNSDDCKLISDDESLRDDCYILTATDEQISMKLNEEIKEDLLSRSSSYLKKSMPSIPQEHIKFESIILEKFEKNQCTRNLTPIDHYFNKIFKVKYTLALSKLFNSSSIYPNYPEIVLIYDNESKLLCTKGMMDCRVSKILCPPYKLQDSESALTELKEKCNLSANYFSVNEYIRMHIWDGFHPEMSTLLNETDPSYVWSLGQLIYGDRRTMMEWIVEMDPGNGKILSDNSMVCQTEN